MHPKTAIKKLLPHQALTTYHLAMSWFAAARYGHPSRKMIVIGVTGTKGKSTTVNLIAQLLENLGQKVGLTSTINFKVGSREWLNDKKMTMLGRTQTQQLLQQMVDAGCTYAIVETSSEGIVQARHRFIEYDTCVFTNLTPEHIESHGSFENYRAAKEQLFRHLSRFRQKKLNGHVIPKTIIANLDDTESSRILAFNADKKITYGTNDRADITLTKVMATGTGGSFMANGQAITTPLLGEFNIMNTAAAVAVASSCGFTLPDIARAAAKLRPLPGRQEWINAGQNFKVMVDYAYEPESQRQLYRFLSLVPHTRTIHVTGSTGGGRDTSRRPILGQLAAEHADIVIVTNEDPYDDDPQQIIDQVAKGARGAGKQDGTTLFVISDRREAIHQALRLAQPNDLVLITGKGCEQAMCIAHGKKIPWDDRSVVREFLKP